MIKIRVTGKPDEVSEVVKILTFSSDFEVLYASTPYSRSRKSDITLYEAVYLDCEVKKNDPKSDN